MTKKAQLVTVNTPSETGRPLRGLTCDGCSAHCRYADFRAFGPHAGGFAPKQVHNRELEERNRKRRQRGEVFPHGNTKTSNRSRHAGQQLFAEHQQDFFVKTQDRSRWRHRGKGTVLGSMHELKLQMWEQFTSNCPLYGTEEEEGVG